MIALIVLSALLVLVGIRNKWKLQLPKRRDSHGIVPAGDLVVRYPKGNFVIVKCTEDVTRELFFALENVRYLLTNKASYRLLSLIGTGLLMTGIVALANAQVQLQIAYAAAYVTLKIAYRTVAALLNNIRWEKSCFKKDP